MEFPSHPEPRPTPTAARRWGPILAIICLLLVLAVGFYFRITGLMWGDYQYPHPDERFLVWVVADIAPVQHLADYFNTAASSLNPANRGHTFFVYGDFPVILTRYVTEWNFDQVGWEQILQVGRGLSAMFDLLTVLLVYLLVERLSGWKVATVAGLLSAAAVLQIQQAHFFTSDSFSLFFVTLTVFLGVLIITEPDSVSARRLMTLSALYGLATGLSMACKINTAPVALLLPVGLLVRFLRSPRPPAAAPWTEGAAESEKVDEQRWRLASMLTGCAVLGGVVAVIAFRLAMPYAFSGPGLLGVSLDSRWLASLKELQQQSAGDVDFPPALQWARRSHLFSLQNMVIWGLGIPLGVMAWVGFFLYAWRAIRLVRSKRWDVLYHGEMAGTLLVWGWTAVYFTWQSLAWNPTMRYQLPIYPMMAILAAWGLGYLWSRPLLRLRLPFRRAAPRAVSPHPWRTGVGVAGALIVLLTLAWAFAFTRIYTRPETREAASQWIYDNVPGPVTLIGTGSAAEPVDESSAGGQSLISSLAASAKPVSSKQSAGGQGDWNQILSIREEAIIHLNAPYYTWFNNEQSGVLVSVSLQQTNIVVTGALAGEDLRLRARVFDPAQPNQAVAIAETSLPLGGSLDKLDLPTTGLPPLQARRYGLAIEVVRGRGADNPANLNVNVNLGGQVTLNEYARSHVANYQSSNGNMAVLQLTSGGTLRQVRLPAGSNVPGLSIILQNPQTNEIQSAAAKLADAQAPNERTFIVDPALTIKPGVSYLVGLSSTVPGTTLDPNQPALLDFLDDPASQMTPDLTPIAANDDPLWFPFTVQNAVQLQQISLGYAAQVDPTITAPVGIRARIYGNGDTAHPLAEGGVSIALDSSKDPRGQPLTLNFPQPVSLAPGSAYTLALLPDQGLLAVRGSAVANESTWDMGLPFRLGNYDPFGGIYRKDLNFEMYWDDNADKYNRFVNILDQSDDLFFSSNRQWGTTVRIPERYPLTTEFYRRLLGCPPDKDVLWCYRVAEPGMFHGDLGYDLVKTVTSYPNLGPVRINTQFAEEAFTVYDAPKVMIFKKQAAYDPARVRAILGAVDLNKVIHLTPKKASGYRDLLLPAKLWTEQQGGGTFARLFPPEGLLNRFPWLSAVVWYLFILLLGLLTYPLVRLALRGLPDRGYPLARTAGLVLFAYLAWISGSLQIQVTRGLLLAAFLVIAGVGIWLGVLQRDELKAEWRTRKGFFFSVEALALGLFILDLLIRLGNPDLWHPIFGGEKPMDFSFFNAVMKSAIFPPYDPWFEGGYINYYYYGFVLVGMPVKLLGITPSVAYNLILPALFMIVGLGAFSAGWNLYLGVRPFHPHTPGAQIYPAITEPDELLPGVEDPPQRRRSALAAGLVAVLALLILGNLGTVRMYWQGLQKLVVSDQQMQAGTLVEHISWAQQGLSKLVSGQATELPYYLGDWYWKPSRAIQPEDGQEITEFPMFTFLYADLHAHLIALPVTLLVLGWALGMVLGRGRWGLPGADPGQKRRYGALALFLALLLGALAAGELRPNNTWDQYTYLALAALALSYGQWLAARELPPGQRRSLLDSPWVRVLAPVLVLVGASVLLYQPFNNWFEQGYNSLDVWKGHKTDIASYLVHWGLFLFVIISWLFDETVDWMARTPVSALNRLRAGRLWIVAAGAALVLAIILLLSQGVQIAILVVPLGVWVTLLLFRPGQPAARRAVLFMIGTALALTLAVELVAVHGDIGRMNTVFKFYFQAWTLLAISAAAGLLWLWDRLYTWHSGWLTAWTVALALLAFGAGLFPVTATRAKIADRMTPSAPHVLDGMAYMKYSTYTDGQTAETSRQLDLSQDYTAIHWVQAHIPGSPVIVEANTPEYRHWGTRYTIYTGLPGVVGWNWHERQQRTVTPDTWVYDRIDDVGAFYNTTDQGQAQEFLKKYNVQYIVVGQLERVWYSRPGIAKFADFNHVLWDQIYQAGDTVIYKVK